ncbi:hypothetical protein [Methanocella conradii]|uniref:hypothetical protein n=1 Tax=Methanocella conradii TaxID=1175444 RepID=UPI0024B3A558|nr:hypothetical protein [Methanocella conradii]MDI6898019.1 hypothetical protein [Methanocella conradii]
MRRETKQNQSLQQASLKLATANSKERIQAPEMRHILLNQGQNGRTTKKQAKHWRKNMRFKSLLMLASIAFILSIVVPIGASATDAFAYGQWSRIYNNNAEWTKNQAETITTLQGLELHAQSLWYNYNDNPRVTIEKVFIKSRNSQDGAIRYFNVTQDTGYQQQIGPLDVKIAYATGDIGGTYTLELQHSYKIYGHSSWWSTDTSSVKQYHIVG